MAQGRWWVICTIAVALIAVGRQLAKQYGWDKDAVVELFQQLSERLGIWAIPVYVLVHTITLALCLPYAVFFEAGASLLFGFFPAVLCVFSAKVLGASLSFWVGRLVFMWSSSAKDRVQNNKYFHLLSKGVERDGWKFVLLARFSPAPSYVINYALAATNVRFFVDFLLPTVIGCLPMILQNTSVGSLAGTAVASASGRQKSQIWSYLLPLLGILSSILITLRIRKYSKDISLLESSNSDDLVNSQLKSDSQTMAEVISCHTIEQWTGLLDKGEQENKVIIVDFTASWCGPCRFIAPILADLAKKHPSVMFVKVDVDELQAISQEWGVEAMPTFVVIKKKKETERIVGARKDELQGCAAKHAAETA